MSTRVCSHCGKQKQVTEFSFKDKRTGKRHAMCKSCRRAKDNLAYKEDRRDRRAQIRSSLRVRHDALLAYLAEVRDKSQCAKCCEARPYLLDFHHRDPNVKRLGVIQLVHRVCSKPVLLREIAKCIILCSNCHREFHHFVRKSGMTLQAYLER